MKQFILFLAVLMAYPVMSQDSEVTMRFTSILLKPLQGHGPQLRAALKAHNEKYHTEGMDRVQVWAIRSGPRSGSLIWGMGPHNWAHMSAEQKPGHMEDWRTNVNVHLESEGEFTYWTPMNNLSYIPEGHKSKVRHARYLQIKPNKANNARHLSETMHKVRQEINYDVSVTVAESYTDNGDDIDWVILWGHTDWASMDKDRKFRDAYENMYGRGSWEEFFEGWREATHQVKSEIHVLIEDLSTR